jgi:hypothetical protein
MREGPHVDALREALVLDARAHRLLLDGDEAAAAGVLREAAARYRASWELAPPRSYGRLIGMLKAAILAGDATGEARYARAALTEEEPSPPAAYALALAALVEGDDELAARGARAMAPGGEAFARAAAAIAALAAGDRDAYARAGSAIVADFEAREEHLTGVPIADTALVLDRLAERRGLGGLPASPVLPPRTG